MALGTYLRIAAAMDAAREPAANKQQYRCELACAASSVGK
jgi:hypothetical protein